MTLLRHIVRLNRALCKFAAQGCGAVRGSSRSYCVLFVLFVAGALRRSHTEGQQPPNPKGWTSRSRRTSHLDRPPGRPCRESPGLFVLSLAFLGVQQTVVRQSTRATSVDRAAASPSQLPRARLHALLNASAASESTADRS